jgi:pimeloyl-ACP methyl ester carboxylesterase
VASCLTQAHLYRQRSDGLIRFSGIECLQMQRLQLGETTTLYLAENIGNPSLAWSNPQAFDLAFVDLPIRDVATLSDRERRSCNDEDRDGVWPFNKSLTGAAVKHPTFYRTTMLDGVSIFYREAGPRNAPTLLLLHGLPSSSRMFEPLFARLSDRYHLVAPDYPGFGHSDWPDPKTFAYTFDHYAQIMKRFAVALGLERYILYMQDYGGPVGFRMALADPARVEALIVQNAVAHDEGLGELWKPRRAFWADRVTNERSLRANLLSREAARLRHVGSDPNADRYDPDLWTDEFAFLSQPDQADIQADLFYDYRTNVEAYPKWRDWMRRIQPRLLVIWGKYDPSFDLSEPEAYRREVPDAHVHVLNAGHFALDTAADEIALLIRSFVGPSR